MGGVPHFWTRGTPSLDCMGVPPLGLNGGTPPSRDGAHPVRTGWGYLLWDRMGVPPIRTGWGYPSPCGQTDTQTKHYLPSYFVSWGNKYERLILCARSRHGLLAYVYSGVSLTMTECLSGGKWLLYTMAQCP